METQNISNPEDFWKEAEKRHKRGKLIGGIFVVIAGSLFLARELGAELPYWIFTWKTLLIAFGAMLAFKHGFRRPFWLIPIVIGAAYLIGDVYPTLAFRHLLWPILIILFGLMIIFKPHRNYHRFHRRRYRRYYRHQHHHYRQSFQEETSNDDRIETNTFMGAVKKIILSKNFKGGELNNVLGGTELNLSQADFEGTITLEINNVLGGTTLIVPANWEISSELISVLGSIDDKRPVQNTPGQSNKKLILKGTVFMGGIEIKSFSNF